MSQIKKVVKVYLPNNEIRRFQINNKSFEDFTKLLKTQEEIKDIEKLMYQSDDSKWVTFGSECEWKSALDTIGEGILRIKVNCSLKSKNPSVMNYRNSRTDNLPNDFFTVPNFKFVN